MASDPKFFSLVASIGLQQEIGTIHDEFSKFLFEADTGLRVPRETLRAELIEYNGHCGVRIWADGHSQLEPRVKGMRTLLHPEFSFDEAGRIHQCVFFPEVIAKIAALEGVDLVSVRPWGLNTIFGGFDPTKPYYEGNMFELINLDAIRYSRLLERRQIAFFGTHDLVSHVAGVKGTAWPELARRGRAARELFEEYFEGVARPVPYSLVLPYGLGMLLDDLAQPMNYESQSRRHVVDLLMRAIGTRVIDPHSKAYLLKYPPSIERLILLGRADNLADTRARAAGILDDLIHELNSFSVKRAG